MLRLLISVFFVTALSPLLGQEVGSENFRLGLERKDHWLPLLQDKKIGVLVNHTSRTGEGHLVDIMLENGIDIRRIFAPEHGFRGDVDAGELVADGVDPDTGIPVISLYQDSRKPREEDIRDLDVVVFDIQDVGVRFFTYISTMHYMMEACAQNNVQFVVLDRPNPNGDYIDGPVLNPGFRSFVGMHPIPVVHGLTVGELAKMINGEGWLMDSLKCRLTVVPMEEYTHSMYYEPPIKPSPNLPNMLSVRLYPSLCLFEATVMSVGRGTNFPFQVVGAPDPVYGSFTFTPRSIPGMDSQPKYEGEVCYGLDYRGLQPDAQCFSLRPILDFYQKSKEKEQFISRPVWLNLLIGNDRFVNKIKDGWTEAAIKSSWIEELEEYEVTRGKYLLYPI